MCNRRRGHEGRLLVDPGVGLSLGPYRRGIRPVTAFKIKMAVCPEESGLVDPPGVSGTTQSRGGFIRDI